MALLKESRYCLIGVPSGVDDGQLKMVLSQLIGYADGIREVNWWKPAETDDVGGAVRLNIDEKAAELLKQKRGRLFIKGKHVAFVDNRDLPVSAASTIDDDIVTLVKQELAKNTGSGRTWESIVGQLTVTKCQDGNENECWQVVGSFSELRRFQSEIGKVLFGGHDIVTVHGPATGKRKRRNSRTRVVDNTSSDERAIRSTDDDDKSMAIAL